jgi:hypothetical protein
MNQEAALLWLAARELKREESGLNALMDKFLAARKAGLALNDADNARLLALLLDDRLDGIGNYKKSVAER